MQEFYSFIWVVPDGRLGHINAYQSALRRMVKKMHRVLQTLKFKLAKDKIFIGKISRGFDFLGYRFSNEGIIGLAAKTIHNCLQRIAALYEQKASNLRLQQYGELPVSLSQMRIIFTKPAKATSPFSLLH